MTSDPRSAAAGSAPFRVLVAPDKFKGSLSAAEAASAIAAGLRDALPYIQLDCCPVADGGEGTIRAAIAAGYEAVRTTVEGPTGDPVLADYAICGDTALVEMAAASGLNLLSHCGPAPMTASSVGTGELIAHAIDRGARTVILAVGGSACTDGGAGLLRALGAQLVNANGWPVGQGGAALIEVRDLMLAPARERMAGVKLVVASDVDNPLTGRTGAAAVYAPQKGATAAQVEILERSLEHWADVVSSTVGRDLRRCSGAGAGGGVGFAALAAFDAELRPGAELVLELVDFDRRVAQADLVVTGEGSLDRQTLHGKAPARVATTAARHGVPSVVVAGRVLLSVEDLDAACFRSAAAIADLEPDERRSVRHAAELLRDLAAANAKAWVRACMVASSERETKPHLVGNAARRSTSDVPHRSDRAEVGERH